MDDQVDFLVNPVLLPLRPKQNEHQDKQDNSQKAVLQPPAQEVNSTALLTKDWRQVRNLYRKVVRGNAPILSTELKLLGDTILHLTTEVELLRIENEGLRETIINEKRKRKRGKTLFEELRAENDSQATFSTMKIERSPELQEQREQEKQQAAAQKRQDKLQRDISKQER